MGSRINRAIGYGMPWEQFKNLALMERILTKLTQDALYQTFEDATEGDLTVDRDTQRVAFETKGVSPILQPRLLSRVFAPKDDDPVVLGNPEDLFDFVYAGDTITDVLFYPNLVYEKKWHHWDDDVDYAFEQWRGDDLTRKVDPEPRNFTKYVAYGFYPYTNFLMLEDGTPQEWLPFWELQERNDIVPAVPSEIRWYLTKLGVLDDTGVNQLRPILAQWWD